MVNYWYRLNRKKAFLIVCTLILVFTGSSVNAQSDIEWTEPENLSQSGAATAPSFVMDSDGAFHVFWQDALVGFEYVIGSAESWSDPVVVQAPFSSPPFVNLQTAPGELHSPLLAVDESDTLHAVWLDGSSDLYYARSAISGLTDPAGWTTPVLLTESARAVHFVVDQENRLQVAYINSGGDSVGVYHLRSTDGGASWSTPFLIYGSTYLRSAEAGQLNLKLAAGEDDQLYGVWDDPLLDKVFFARSANGGQTWIEPELIDSRQERDSLNAPGPGAIDVMAEGAFVHLVWRAGHQGSNCNLYHRWSADNGVTWEDVNLILESDQVCPEDLQLMLSADGLLFLRSRLENEVYLSAWLEGLWSEPVLQATLAGFVNPETFRPVDFGCLRTKIDLENNLNAMGCGVGQVSDVWYLQRPLGDPEVWFPPLDSDAWTSPTQIGEGTGALSTPILIPAGEDQFHAFWIEQATAVAAEGEEGEAVDTIYYARGDGVEWSRLVPTHRTSAEQLSAALIDQGRLFLVTWLDPDERVLFYSLAEVGDVDVPAEWSAPEIFLNVPSMVSSPALSVNQEADETYLIYSLPFNDDRGTYLIDLSAENELSYTGPYTVFDGAAADLSLVDDPHLAQGENGDLHAIVTHYLLPDQPLALLYAHSEDDGRTWTEPEVVTEGDILWSDIIGVGENQVFRMWQQKEEDGALILWYQVSLDSGETWSRSLRIPDVNGLPGPFTLTDDTLGQLHLFQMGRVEEDENVYRFQDWLWDGESWRFLNDLSFLEERSDFPVIASGMSENGRLVMTYSTSETDSETVEQQNELFSSSRQYDLPAVSLPSPPTPTPTPPPAETPTPTPLPSPTVSIPFSTTQTVDGGAQIGPIDVGSSTGGLIVSVVTTMFIVVVFSVGLYMLRIRGR